MAKDVKKEKKVKQLSNKTRNAETKIKELEGAVKMMQMVFQQVMGGYKQIGNELDGLRHMVTDLQYRFVAIVEQLGVNSEDLDDLVSIKKVADFTGAANDQDVKEGLVPAEVITENSVVRITSTTADPKEAIFRARLKVFEPLLPGLKEKWLGCKVGDKVDCDINGIMHNIEFLDIKAKPAEEKKEEVPAATVN